MSVLTVAYLGAAILFILSLGGLSTQESARRGNWYGIIGMVIALAATMLHDEVRTYEVTANSALAATIVVGCAIGFVLAKRVKMTEMPELVAILHSFVGLAAVLVGFSSFIAPFTVVEGTAHTIHNVEIYLDVAIGAVTFTGSVVAWAKLRGKIFGLWKALIASGAALSLGMLVGIFVLPFPSFL